MNQSTSNYSKKRDDAITFAKFIATFLVLNSHMAICYPPQFSYFATGGAFGNALFFFISGFTLFLGSKYSFPFFFKKRIQRIYPPVFAIALCACILWNSSENFVQALTHYWFINCIIAYYVILWICRHFDLSIKHVTIISLLISCAIFIVSYDFENSEIIYGNKIYRYFIYFTFMAFGAYVGINSSKITYKHWHLLLLLSSIIAWYAISAIFISSLYQLASIICLYGVCYGVYACGKSHLVKYLFQIRFFNFLFTVCGGLCLEVYLVQNYIFTDVLNTIFPLNIPIIMFIVIVIAWVIRIMGRFISQTFDSKPYNWKDLLII